MRKIKNSSEVLVSADKTTNLYRISRDNYKEMLRDNISKTYKPAGVGVKQAIDRDAGRIATELGIAERVEICATKVAYITLKDHKQNFWNRPACRLINPAKSEIGIVSKHIVEQLNSDIRAATGLKQWRNTQSVINWFKNLQSRENMSFIKFDIVEFYPSITEELLRKAINFAKLHTTRSYGTQESHSSSTMTRLGSKETVAVLT